MRTAQLDITKDETEQSITKRLRARKIISVLRAVFDIDGRLYYVAKVQYERKGDRKV